jgi:undecaprenyl-phosphate 4-deoxy-4-formamido-L-arabinose transferase
VPVAHDERHHGASKYSFLKLVRLQFDLMTSFSVLPLRVTMGIGVVMSILSTILALVLIGGRLIFGHEWAVSGVFTLFALVFLFLGVQLFAIGLLGEYVGRIYQQVRHRPRFIVRQVIRDGVGAPGGVEMR